MTDVDVIWGTSAISVISLRETPDVVISNVLGVCFTERLLIVESLIAVAPHFLQPVQTERRFAGEIGRGGSRTHLIGKVAHTKEHHAHRITVRLDKFQVVPRIPPASGGINHCSGRCKTAREAPVLVHSGGKIGRGTLVI